MLVCRVPVPRVMMASSKASGSGLRPPGPPAGCEAGRAVCCRGRRPGSPRPSCPRAPPAVREAPDRAGMPGRAGRPAAPPAGQLRRPVLRWGWRRGERRRTVPFSSMTSATTWCAHCRTSAVSAASIDRPRTSWVATTFPRVKGLPGVRRVRYRPRGWSTWRQ